MQVINRNIIANYLGRIWISVVGIVFVPVYISFLGVEAFGVIGFYAALLSFLSFFDLGVSHTLMREAARSNVDSSSNRDFQELTVSLESIYLLISFLAMFCIYILSHWLAKNWLTSEVITTKELGASISIMGGAATLSWAKGFYRSGLIGLQKQVWLNAAESIFVLVRGVGVIFCLVVFEPSLKVFFLYQGLLSLVEFLVYRAKFWSDMAVEGAPLPRFSLAQIQRVWRFSGGVALVSIAGSCISQLDKLLLPGLISLKEFGYYMIAHTIGRSLSQLVAPVALAYRPIFTGHVANNQCVLLHQDYHKASQLMAVSIIPISVFVAVFSSEILLLWTGDLQISSATASVMSLLALGTMLNGLTNIHYSVQLAYGWLSAAIKINITLAIFLVPVFIVSVNTYGLIASGWVWFILNCVYVCINILVLHHRYMKGGWKEWYLKDNGPVVLISCLFALTFHYFMSGVESSYYVVSLVLLLLFLMIFSIFSVKYPRELLIGFIKKGGRRAKN